MGGHAGQILAYAGELAAEGLFCCLCADTGGLRMRKGFARNDFSVRVNAADQFHVATVALGFDHEDISHVVGGLVNLGDGLGKPLDLELLKAVGEEWFPGARLRRAQRQRPQ